MYRQRPYLSLGIDELEKKFEQADDCADLKELELLRIELTGRSTKRSQQLMNLVEARLGNRPTIFQNQVLSVSAGELNKHIGQDENLNLGDSASPTLSSANCRKPRNLFGASDFNPTSEQSECLRQFETGENLKISAYAGTGKTSTLQLIARSTSEPATYLAFNRAIANEAIRKFPPNVDCRTIHSLAYQAVAKEEN